MFASYQGFAGSVADLPHEIDKLVQIGEGLARVTGPEVHAADVVEGGGFACPVTDLTVDGEGLVEVVERPLPIPKMR